MEPPAYRFCPSCGNPLESRRLKAGDPERPVCIACGHIVYLDPKVAVGTIIRVPSDPRDPRDPRLVNNPRLVLVRRAIEPGYGLWVFPGGYVDQGEEITAAAIREAREESGLDIRIDDLLNVYSYGGRSPIIVVYTATALAGELCVDEECLEARLFMREEIPWNELAFRSTAEALREYFEAHRPSTGVKSSG
jgi:ADP-ribose pyrophosphatase YjhB (NUDIX family)